MHGEFEGFFTIKQVKKPCALSVVKHLHKVKGATPCVLYNRTEHSQGFFIC